LRAQIGDEIDGWKVSQIEGRKVVLSLDGRFATFKLFNDDRGRSGPPAGQLQPHRAKRKIRSDGFRRSKLTAGCCTATWSARKHRRSRE